MPSTALLRPTLTVPDEETAAQAADAVDALERFLREESITDALTVKLVAAGHDATLTVPGHALDLLVEMLAQIANGNAVTVAPVHAELTTQQAADLLNVSRPYVVKLLDDGAIPHRRVGNRRRVLLSDLLDYKQADDARCAEAADALAAEAQALGLY